MLAEDDDDDVRALLKEAEAEVAELEPLIRQAMVEPDPNDQRDVIVELRAGAGGELVIQQFNPAGPLVIGSEIADNTSATTLFKSGPGTAVLSAV
jgi:hypothetical protein